MRPLRSGLLVGILLFPLLSTPAVDNSFKLDFNGDGRTDIAIYREGTRTGAPQSSFWYFLDPSNGFVWSTQWGRTLDVPAPADYDGDGITDPGIYRWWDFSIGDTNEWWIRESGGGHHVLLSYEPGYHKFSRNYTGDARAELGQIYQIDVSQNPGENCFMSVYFIAEFTGHVIRKTVGSACNVAPIPVPGDYNNDGRSEIAVFENQTFKVWLPPYNSASTPPDIVSTLDIATPVPGDYDGDGKTDFAGVKPENGRLVWRIKSSRNGRLLEYDFGFATDKPVAGDYDGDNKTDIAIWRSSQSAWWIWNSSTSSLSLFYYGFPTDTPLAMPVIPFDSAS